MTTTGCRNVTEHGPHRTLCNRPTSGEGDLCATHARVAVKSFEKKLRRLIREGDAGELTAVCARYPLAVVALDRITAA